MPPFSAWSPCFPLFDLSSALDWVLQQPFSAASPRRFHHRQANIIISGGGQPFSGKELRMQRRTPAKDHEAKIKRSIIVPFFAAKPPMNRFKYTLCERKIDFLSASSLFLSPGLASGLAVPASGKSRGKSKPATADAFNDNLLMVKILAKNTTEGHHPVFAFFSFLLSVERHPPTQQEQEKVTA